VQDGVSWLGFKKEERVSLPCGPWENGARLEG